MPGRKGRCRANTMLLADEPAGRPVGHRDLPAGPADPNQFRGGPLGARREDRAEHADDEVERGVGIGQRLDIALVEADVQARAPGALAPASNRLGAISTPVT